MQNENLFYRRLFLASVGILLLNDFYLKSQFHNALTGKLSDFAGLFAFSYFVSVLFKKHIKLVCVGTGILFVFWKSPASQVFIDFANTIGIGASRVVDYSDLLALLILPLSYHYRIQKSPMISSLKWLPKPIIIGTCVFAFTATTLLTESGAIDLKSNYQILVDKPKDDVISLLKNTYKTKIDSKYHTTVAVPKKRSRVFLSIELLEQEDERTLIKLDSIKSFTTYSGGIFMGGVKKKHVDYVKQLKLEDFEQLFIEQKINRLKR